MCVNWQQLPDCLPHFIMQLQTRIWGLGFSQSCSFLDYDAAFTDLLQTVWRGTLPSSSLQSKNKKLLEQSVVNAKQVP